MAADCTELSYQWQHPLPAGLQAGGTFTLRVFTQHLCPWVGSPSDYLWSTYHVTRGNFPLWEQVETATEDEPKAENMNASLKLAVPGRCSVHYITRYPKCWKEQNIY